MSGGTQSATAEQSCGAKGCCVGTGLSVLACQCWPVGTGLSVLACRYWPVSTGLSVLACQYWPVGSGLLVMACRFWPVGTGLSVLVCSHRPVPRLQMSDLSPIHFECLNTTSHVCACCACCAYPVPALHRQGLHTASQRNSRHKASTKLSPQLYLPGSVICNLTTPAYVVYRCSSCCQVLICQVDVVNAAALSDGENVSVLHRYHRATCTIAALLG
jgi:hypothetical protein